MEAVFVIHAEADLPFIRETLTRPLPSTGFSRWVSSRQLGRTSDRLQRVAELMSQSHAILAVVSRASIASSEVHEELALAVESKRPTIIVTTYPMTAAERPPVTPTFWSLPIVDFTQPGEAAWRELAALLPAVDASPGLGAAEIHDADLQPAERIEWNEEVFSARLAEAVVCHDHNRAEALIANFARHTTSREHPYPAPHAAKDLGSLRRDRQFKLMQRYAEAAIASGTRTAVVRRQYAQSLIELGMFSRALDVLGSVVTDAEAPPGEIVEARGLIGRVYKQQYGDAPNAPGAAMLLRRAISAYATVYEEDSTQLWHGVNAVSLTHRARRDGLADADPARAREIATEILATLDRLEREGKLNVWDYATRVEALIGLGQYDAASAALDDYLKHPGMHAFEVSSTYRQFDHVLRLGDDERGRGILERLWKAVERHRAPGLSPLPPARRTRTAESVQAGTAPRDQRALLIRVADPDWNPGRIVDLEIEARLGTIVSARGSEASIRSLLGDPSVISVKESRAGGVQECDRSVPFIRVAANYPGPGGPFTEKGSRALIAVIDDGIDVRHEAFLDAKGQSRIVGIWDQRDPTGPPPAGFKLGTYHDAAAIARYVRDGNLPPGLVHKPTDSGHGTHVASIAAGRAIGKFAGGVAPEASLLVVISASREPIGYSASHVAALAFIDADATRLGRPVVVNVSQGMNAGAHDGKSELEVAFDEFSKGGRKPGRVVVKSSGNERAKGGHAKVTVPQGGIEDLRWTRDPDASPGERLELWWDSADELEFRLIAPTGAQTPWISTAAPAPSPPFAGGVPCVIQITKRHIDNGDSHLMIAIDDAVGIAAGTWQLDLVGVQVQKGGEVHAWIERGTGVPSAFQNHATEEMTISIPGTAQTVITVGAVDAANPIKVGGFSSYGPTRDGREKPDIAAPGVNVKAAWAGTKNDAVPNDGTSMAAPHVTGAIALLLSRMASSGRPIPTSTQIASALRQKTRNYSARWDRGQGYGVIDVAALLAAF